MRKLAVIELLRHVRVSEIEAGMNELYRLGESPVVISEWLEQLTLNIIVRMIAGKRYFARGEAAEEEESKRFRRVIKEFMYASGDFPVSDLIPFPPLRWLDSISGALKRVKRVMEEVDWFVERWIEEHQQRRLEGGSSGEQEGDFIDVMLSTIDDTFASEHTRQTIVKATTMNLILAGSDTTSVHLTWILSALLNNRRELKRAQEEIDSKVGKDRWVQDSDINNLVYLQAIVKETLRLYPPGPLSVPHLSTENCTIGGYFIPSGTRLLVNTWKLHRDPRVWSEPDKFMPERFLTRHADVDVSGHNFEFTPFGSGRRACPGIALAFQVSHLTLARLLQGFEFETPSGEPVDMAGGSGLTMPKVEPLKVRLTPRLASKLYE
ncbi:Unspecific monooxygenase [Bertholletia excelsa]